VWLATSTVVLSLVGVACAPNSASSASAACSATIPQVAVKFSEAEFLDDTPHIIGVTQGYFKKVGITLSPPPIGSVHTPSTHASLFLNGTEDVIATNYGELLPAVQYASNLRMFAYGDFFVGYAIMGKPSFKSFSELVAGGMDKDTALKTAIGQLSGHTLSWSLGPATRDPGKALFELAGVPLSSINQLSLPDAEGVQQMLAGRSDFLIDGAAGTITLLKAGFKRIIGAADLTGLVKPPFDSPSSTTILALVVTNGIGTTLGYYQKNPDTVMRLAAVEWAISQYIHDHPDLAAPVHVAQLNRVAGTSLTEADAKIVYSTIDPYIQFTDQGPLWFDDPAKPTFELNMIQALINSKVTSGAFKPGVVKPENITMAAEIYHKAVDLKKQTDSLLAQVQSGSSSASSDKQAAAQKLVQSAKDYYNMFDYLDSQRFACAANKTLTS
jgi:hypothetical protein